MDKRQTKRKHCSDFCIHKPVSWEQIEPKWAGLQSSLLLSCISDASAPPTGGAWFSICLVSYTPFFNRRSVVRASSSYDLRRRHTQLYWDLVQCDEEYCPFRKYWNGKASSRSGLRSKDESETVDQNFMIFMSKRVRTCHLWRQSDRLIFKWAKVLEQIQSLTVNNT